MIKAIRERQNSLLRKQAKKKIAEIKTNEDALIVLKGIPLSLIDSSIELYYLEDIASNKLNYLFHEIYGKRKYLVYDEFLLLKNLGSV